jgi:hypothetical protein
VFVSVGKVTLGTRRLHPVGEEWQSQPDRLAQDDRLFFPGQADDVRQLVSSFLVQINGGSHDASDYTFQVQMQVAGHMFEARATLFFRHAAACFAVLQNTGR